MEKDCRGCYAGVPVVVVPVYEGEYRPGVVNSGTVVLEPVCAPCYGAVMVNGRMLSTLVMLSGELVPVAAIRRSTLDEYAALAVAVRCL